MPKVFDSLIIHLEIVNTILLTNIKNNSNNSKTYKWASENNMIMVSGSDFHEEEDLAKGGIITETSFISIKELVEIIKAGNYSIIEN